MSPVLPYQELKEFVHNASFINEHEISKMYSGNGTTLLEHGKELLEYCKHLNVVSFLNEELKRLIIKNTDLNNPEVQSWCERTKDFFNDELFSFGLNFMDSGNDTENYLHIPPIDLYIENKEVIELVNFWNAQWILYFGKYYIPKELRRPPDPPGSYYSLGKDPNEPSDIEKVKKIYGI